METILALILSVALEVGIPPYFAQAIAYAEHWNGSVENTVINPKADTNVNEDKSIDLGVMQLNSRYINDFVFLFWDKPWEFKWESPYDNIYIGCKQIEWLMKRCTTYWSVAVAYNCGIDRVLKGNPPHRSTVYADRVIRIWNELSGGRARTLVLSSYEEWNYSVWVADIIYGLELKSRN